MMKATLFYEDLFPSVQFKFNQLLRITPPPPTPKKKERKKKKEKINLILCIYILLMLLENPHYFKLNI
jgi:hypothetical protein